ncbi:MAG: DUF4270 family protein [Phaeodactylibacter sp.]|nr:DUF4270 family protein [Phaeodactylibacter sp.]MCB9272993.1 DUF4270 family protein [Lewinellaceae bacterium]
MKLSAALFPALAFSLLLASCADPILAGGSLLGQDKADVDFTDTLSIRASTISNDSIRTYSPFTSSQLSNYLFGTFNDPVFGKTTASIFAQVYPESRSPVFGDITIDSIVLILPYYEDGNYGPIDDELFGMDVMRLEETLDENEEYYSNKDIAVNPIALGSITTTPSLDSLEFIDYEGTDPDTLNFAFFRVPLDTNLARELVSLDTSIYRSDSLFFEAFKGIKLQPSTDNNKGLLGFDLTSSRAGIYLFYRDTSGAARRFLYDFDPTPTVRYTRYEHDYSGSKAAPFIDNPNMGDSLLFVQGMSGLDVKLEIPNVQNLSGLAVNKAELEFYVASLDGDDPDAYPPIVQLILTAPNSDGEIVAIDDIEIVLSRGLSLSDVFGGAPLEGSDGGPMVYRMNLSAHFQNVLDGTVGNTLYITPYLKGERASRVALYGAKHPQYAIKLKLAFTRL